MNKGDIVKKLREQGLSRRSAVRIFNQIFAEMAAALSRGEAVEFPFGSETNPSRTQGAAGPVPG
jgi:nucleoid DNA-binding protein